MSSTSSISQQIFEGALQNAQTLEKHGEAFEKLAKSLDKRLLTGEQAVFIEQVGQQIQQHARLMKTVAELALQNKHYSLEEQTLVQQQHYQAVLLHLQAIKVMLLSQPLL